MTAGVGFKDHFSGHAAAYARFRPGYPDSLFDWLAETVTTRTLAGDGGTGNGQVGRGLATRFQRVLATDASARQLDQASGPDNVTFREEPAEACSLPSGSVDLVTVGQALHWFDQERFHAEVRRVLHPGGLLAAWTYQLNRIDPEVDAVVWAFYDEVVGPYWPPERVHVERGYTDLPFPLDEIETPKLELVTEMDLADFLAYVGTWSAVRRYVADRGADPLPALGTALEEPWGCEGRSRRVCWPLSIRAGRSPGLRAPGQA